MKLLLCIIISIGIFGCEGQMDNTPLSCGLLKQTKAKNIKWEQTKLIGELFYTGLFFDNTVWLRDSIFGARLFVAYDGETLLTEKGKCSNDLYLYVKNKKLRDKEAKTLKAKRKLNNIIKTLNSDEK